MVLLDASGWTSPNQKPRDALADFQIEFCQSVIKHAQEKDPNFPLLMHINKGRQMGFTEIVLRLIQYFCFNRYAGRPVGIIAATSGDLAKEDIKRLYQLYKDGIPEALAGPMVNDTISLKNGTTIRAFKASEEAMTGFTKFACIFMDEAAKWKLLDDSAIFDSIMPIIRSNASDLFLVSTPKGRVKMFYKIHKDADSKFIKFRYPIERAVGSLHTKETVQELINSTVEDPAQEYHCQFESSEDSIFNITEKDQESFQELKLYDDWKDDSYYEKPIEA